MKQLLICATLVGIVCGQFPPGPPPGPPGKWPGNRPSGYPKQPMVPQRGSPFGSLSSVLPGGSGNRDSQAPLNYDDPIPQMPSDPSYDSQYLPSRLPILAPNGVYEIYNRVVDDLIARLEVDFTKKKMDPMEVVIRPTPPGPVRVPGHLQRRPFRRPGAPLYRAGAISAPPPPPPFGGPGMGGPPSMKKKKSRSVTTSESRFPEGKRPAVGAVETEEAKETDAAVRANAKVSKSPVETKDDVVVETTTAGVVVEEVKVNSAEDTADDDAASSEEAVHMVGKSRSEEMAEDELDDETDDLVTVKLRKKTKKDDTHEEEDEEDAAAAAPKPSLTKVDSLVEKYANKNTAGTKYAAANTKKPIKQAVVDKNVSEDDDDDDTEDQERDDVSDDDDDLHFDSEPGTPNGRPNGGYYPPGGSPAVPAKPNAMLSGLSKMRRTSDVSVVLDARSAMITARLLVGPITVQINDSMEPKERGIKATIPELEAEMIMMERHGVVFLQRFTLDRAYGQDVEISIPKSKSSSSKKKNTKNSNQGRPGQPGFDPSDNPAAQDRYQTKMAAHISMEVVKLLRSGNLRVNLMRTAQGSMTKLKLPIQKKTKKTKKEKKQEALKNKSKETL